MTTDELLNYRFADLTLEVVEICMVAYCDGYGWSPFCRRLDQHAFDCE